MEQRLKDQLDYAIGAFNEIPFLTEVLCSAIDRFIDQDGINDFINKATTRVDVYDSSQALRNAADMIDGLKYLRYGLE